MGRGPEWHCEKLGCCLGCLNPDSAFWITHSMVGRVWVLLPGEDVLASQPAWWLGGQGSTGRQSAENKGTQEHLLAKTRQARSFKKYILFLNSCQQFLQIWKPLEISFPFPSSLFLVCVYICIYLFLLGYWARSCQMSKLFIREGSWLRYLFWSNINLGHGKLNSRVLYRQNGSTGENADLEAESLGSNLALPFITVTWEVTMGTLRTHCEWGQQFLVLANKDDDDG